MVLHDLLCNNIAADYQAQTSVCVCVSDIPLMRLEILNTFITAVTDDDDDEDDTEAGGASCLLRRHSAPAALHYTDRVSLLAEPKTARNRQKKRSAKAQNASLAAAAAVADEAVLIEFAAKVEEERLEGGEPEPPSAALTRRRERRQQAKAKGSAADNNPSVRLRLRFRGPDEERPSNAIFLLREDANAEIGFAYDPDWSTTELRDRLLRINGCEEDDDAVVTTIEGQLVRAGSTLREQHVMRGARLRLVRVGSSENDCAQS